MPITCYFIIKVRWNCFANYPSDEEISEWNESKLVKLTCKNATKDFSETVLKIVDNSTFQP